MSEFEYNQMIEYIDGTFDENFNAARQWAMLHNTTFEENVEMREEFFGKRMETYQDPETGAEVENEVNYPTLKRFWFIGEEPKPYVPPLLLVVDIHPPLVGYLPFILNLLVPLFDNVK